MAGSRAAIFEKEFREDLGHWVQVDRRVALRLLDLVESVMRDSFQGIGKPEPMKHLGPDIWSRRLTQEHRLIYMIQRDAVSFLKARYHY